MPKYKEACGVAKISATAIKLELNLAPEKKKVESEANKK